MFFDSNVPLGGRFEAFEEKVCKVLPCGAVKTLVVLAFVPCILNIFEEVFLGIYDHQPVIKIGVWPSVKYLVKSINKFKIFLMCLAFVLRVLWGLSIAFNPLRLLIQETFVDVTSRPGNWFGFNQTKPKKLKQSVYFFCSETNIGSVCLAAKNNQTKSIKLRN